MTDQFRQAISQTNFTALDWGIVACYLMISVVIGLLEVFRCYDGLKSTDGFIQTEYLGFRWNSGRTNHSFKHFEVFEAEE